MADLTNLDGMGKAYNDLYQKIESGEVDERKATTMIRALRGLESLKVTQPIRLLSVVARFKGTDGEKYVGPLVAGLVRFTAGEAALSHIENRKPAK
jgi:hypothetical protein